MNIVIASRLDEFKGTSGIISIGGNSTSLFAIRVNTLHFEHFYLTGPAGRCLFSLYH